MTDNSPLERAQRELGEGRPAWAQSPLMLLAGLILVAGLVAVLVTTLGGGDESADTPTVVATDADATEPDATESGAAAAAPTGFGGDGIPEVAAVEVSGDALPAYTGEGADPALGLTVPTTRATNLATGDQIELAAGTPRIIGFFAHWCPHCQAELPELTAWLQDEGLPGNTEFVAVSTVVDAERGNYPPSAWFNAEGWSQTVVVDDEAASLLQAYGFTGFPAFIAIDADGTVLDRLGGNAGVPGFERLASALG